MSINLEIKKILDQQIILNNHLKSLLEQHIKRHNYDEMNLFLYEIVASIYFIFLFF